MRWHFVRVIDTDSDGQVIRDVADVAYDTSTVWDALSAGRESVTTHLPGNVTRVYSLGLGHHAVTALDA